MFSMKVSSCRGLVSYQGAERIRALEVGLSPSGAADRHALEISNYLLGNAPHATAIEIWWGGISFEILTAGTFSYCGADLGLLISGEQVAPFQSFNVLKGDKLEFTKPIAGNVTYLQIPGGFEIESECLREAPTQIRTDLVLKGGPIKDKQTMEIYRENKDASLKFFPHPLLQIEYGHWFEELENLALKIIETSRMALKISGLPLLPEKKEFLSKPTPYGGLQLTPDGSAYILLSERQSVGGYPVMGILHPKALHTLINLKRGGKFSIDLMSQF